MLSASGKSVKMYRLSIQGQHLAMLTEKGISDAATSSSADEVVSRVATKANIWVPLPILRLTRPDLVKKGDEGLACEASASSFQNVAFRLTVFCVGQTTTSESVINLTGTDVDINIIDLSGIMASDPSIGEDEAVMDEDSDSEIEIVDI